MKNIFLGIIGMFLLLYITILQLGMFQIYTRKNEINNCLSEVLESTLKDNFYHLEDINPGVCQPIVYGNQESDKSKEEIIKQVKADLKLRLGSESDIDIQVFVCDMEKGILSAEITERFLLLGGGERIISEKKTVIVERTEM